MAGPQQNTNYMVIIHSTNVENGKKSITVTAPMPEQFTFDMSNSYEAPFAQGLLQDQTLRMAASAIGVRTATPAMTAQLWQGTSDTELSVDLEFHTENDPIADVRQPILDLLRLVTPSVDPTTSLLKSPGPSIEPSLEALKALGGDSLASIGSTIGSVIQKLTGVEPPKWLQNGLQNPDKTAIAGNGGSTQTSITPAVFGSTEYWKSHIKNQISLQIGNYAFFDSVVILGVQQTFMSAIDPLTGWPHHVKVNVRFKPLFMIVESDLEKIFITKQSTSSGGGPLGALTGLFLGG